MRHSLTIFFLLLVCPLSAKPGALPPPVIPQCFGVNAASLVEADAELDRLEAGGFGWVRVPLPWADTEKTESVYDFTATDALIAGLAVHRLEPLLVLGGTTPLYSPGRTTELAFEHFVAAAVERYRGKGVLWEVGADAPARQTAHAIRATDPDAVVVLTADTQALSAHAIAGPVADAVAVRTQGGPEDTGAYQSAHRLLQTSTPAGMEAPLISVPPASSQDAVAGPTRAQALVRHWLSDLAAGVRLSVCEDVTSEASAPALLAARSLIRTLNGYRFIKRVPLTSPNDYLLVFARGPGGLKIALWTAGADHALLLPIAAVAAGTGMTGDAVPAVPSQGRLSLTLTGSPVYLDVPGDVALRQAGAWVAVPDATFYTSGRPLRLALTYRNPDAAAHRVRFVTLVTTPDGARTPLPTGEDIVAPHQTLTLGIQAPALAGSPAVARVGLLLDGKRQPYPQDVGFEPRTPLALTVAPLTALQVRVRVDDPEGVAFSGRLSATGSGGVASVPVILRKGETEATVTVPVRPETSEAWRLRDLSGRLAASLPAQRLVPCPLSAELVPPTGIVPPAASGQAVWQIREAQPSLLPGRPTDYGLWVFGDADGGQLGMEFQGNDGQTYRVPGPRLTWAGWRFVAFPLHPTSGTPPVEYLIKITALLWLGAPPDARRRAGPPRWKGPTIIYEAPIVAHRV